MQNRASIVSLLRHCRYSIIIAQIPIHCKIFFKKVKNGGINKTGQSILLIPLITS